MIRVGLACIVGIAGVVGVVACGAPRVTDHATLAVAAADRMVVIPAGRYVAGSTPEERAAAYDDYQATAKRDVARENHWFDREEERHVAQLPAFRIDLLPVTQAEYAEYVATGKVKAPTMDAATWRAQGFSQDYEVEVRRYVWRDNRPPPGREDHPVVLVSWRDAAGYCAWRGHRLPTAAEYEKAARGDNGLAYPWGNTFDAARLDSAVAGPRDTEAVGNFPGGASPFGVLGMAGNAFEWTATPWREPGASVTEPATKMTVKGSAWDDFGGVGRGASGHGRAVDARHVIVGFRCAADAT